MVNLMDDVKGQSTTAPPRRRLSRAESQARTRAALVDAAEDVFAERGYHGTSVEEVVARAGFSRGAFYSNFADKDELFLAVFDERASADVAEVGEIVSGSTSIAELAAALRDRGRAERDERTWRILLAEVRLHALRQPAMQPLLAAREQAQRAAYRLAVEHMLGVAGVAPTDDIDLVALILQVIDDGIAFHRDLEPDAVPWTFADALELLARSTAAFGGGADGAAGPRPDDARSPGS